MQFVSAFQHLLRKIFQADPKWGPEFLMKRDIADGFYQCCLQSKGLERLGLVILLDTRYRNPLISFHLLDPMGWVESPPFFTALYETA